MTRQSLGWVNVVHQQLANNVCLEFNAHAGPLGGYRRLPEERAGEAGRHRGSSKTDLIWHQ
jgi:hypothetical protein